MLKWRVRLMHDVPKRIFDIIGSAIAIIVFAPLLIVAAILIKLDGGPIFFVQPRVGRNGKLFGMLKLRTMVPNAHKLESRLRRENAENGGYGNGTYCDPRVTKIGSLLRLLNLDELPQLINVLKGDMSLVGPRPVPHEESFLFGYMREQILSVRPGLTGYWQVKRHAFMSYEERVELDDYYTRHKNLLLDAYILLATPFAMLTSDYNSLTKPLPPPVDGILVSDRAFSRLGDSLNSREESLIQAGSDQQP